MSRGIDISAWQENIDWQKAKDAGIEFVIIKLGQNNRMDQIFEAHLYHAQQAGMKIGVYFYAMAKSYERAQYEAAWVKEMLDKYFGGQCPEMGVWYDVEDPSIQASELTYICRAFVEFLNNAGYPYVGIYSSYNWLTNYIDTRSLDVPYWCAQYYRTCDFQHPQLKLWQYTDHFSDDLPYDANVTI